MRANQWAMRLMDEKEYHEKACFVTLTYNDESLPINGSLEKDILQKFIKRIRKEIEPRKIKYFACGEYGRLRGRPHYHAIFFGMACSDKEIIFRQWNRGFIKIGNVDFKSCRYVAKYITVAPLGRTRRDRQVDERTPEFQIQSRGLGLSWIMENAQAVGASGIRYHGRPVCVPRYYVDKLRDKGVSVEFAEDSKADRVQESRLRYRSWIAEGLTDDDIKARMAGLRQQRIEEVRSQDSLYGHDLDNQ